MCFVGKKIAVNMPGQSLIYDIYDNMLVRVLPFQINKLGEKNS